jgi:hypothetical protein
MSIRSPGGVAEPSGTSESWLMIEPETVQQQINEQHKVDNLAAINFKRMLRTQNKRTTKTTSRDESLIITGN